MGYYFPHHNYEPQAMYRLKSLPFSSETKEKRAKIFFWLSIDEKHLRFKASYWILLTFKLFYIIFNDWIDFGFKRRVFFTNDFVELGKLWFKQIKIIGYKKHLSENFKKYHLENCYVFSQAFIYKWINQFPMIMISFYSLKIIGNNLE